MTRDTFHRRPWLQRLVLILAFVTFLFPAAIGPLGTLCFCLEGDDTSVLVGACCCEQHPATPFSGASESDGVRSAVLGDGDPGSCTCVDLNGESEPAALDRRVDPLSAPAVVALPTAAMAVPTADIVPSASAWLRAPPERRAAPPRRIVLRC